MVSLAAAPSPSSPSSIPVILVLSGKGGVGKSTLATQLATHLAYCHSSFKKEMIVDCHDSVKVHTSAVSSAETTQSTTATTTTATTTTATTTTTSTTTNTTTTTIPSSSSSSAVVGLLDIDLTGPSLPGMLRLSAAQVLRHPVSGKWMPVELTTTTNTATSTTADASSCSSHNAKLKVMSIGFLMENKDDAVVWRGPKKNAMIGQFMDNVEWGGQDDDLDYLVIDTPPGTSDEHITIVEHLLKQQQEASSSASSRRVFELKGAVLVTSPQAVSLQDVRKEINFCRKVGVKTLGLVENFSGYVCPHCQECTAIFSKGGGEALANEFGIPFLGCVLIDPALARLFEEDDDEGEVEGDEEEGTSSSTTSSTPSPHRKQPFNILSRFKQSALAPLFEDMVAKIIKNMT